MGVQGSHRVHGLWLQTEPRCRPRRASRAPSLVLLQPFLPGPPAFHVSCVWPVVCVSFPGALLLQSGLGEVEQGTEPKRRACEKTVTPTYCPDMKDKLEIPRTKLAQPSKFKNIHILCFTNKNSKHEFLSDAKTASYLNVVTLAGPAPVHSRHILAIPPNRMRVQPVTLRLLGTRGTGDHGS